MKLEHSVPSSVTPGIRGRSTKSRGRASFSLVGAIAAALVWAGIAASGAQQLPPGGGPIPPVRRGPDGKIEVVPPGAKPPAAETSPNAGARPATSRAGTAPSDAASETAGARPATSAPGAAPADAAAESTRPSTQRAPVKDIPASDNNSSPGATVVSQIHNAPGWQHSHAYTYATGPDTRVVNGPGQNEASDTYNPGRTLEAYQLTSTGNCTSAASGGPTGTGSAIQDGTCIWKYLSPVDYISLTGWAFDSKPWQSGATYNYRDYVVSDSPLRAYALDNENCTSTVAPTGKGQNSVLKTNDSCQWRYFAVIIYSSQKSYMPTETFVFHKGPITYNIKFNYEANLWNDREYLAGANGELSPIRIQAHFDYTDDVNSGENSAGIKCITTCYHIIVTTAPGESFRDKLTPSDPLTGYDPTKGVAIRNSTLPTWNSQGFLLRDGPIDLIGLQIKSGHTSAVAGLSTNSHDVTIRDSILEGGAEDATVMFDIGPSVIANSLVISHAKIGVISKYPMVILHSTIVNPDRTPDSIGIESYWKWYFNGTVISNTGVFGFAHAAAHQASAASFWLADSSHNATDASATDSGSLVSFNKTTVEVDPLPGAIYGVSMAGSFVKPGSDWRLSSGSPLRGAGSAYGSFFDVVCAPQARQCPRSTYNFDSPDIIATARPQAGQYDIGAWQSTPASTAK